MSDNANDCDLDLVIEMDEAGVGLAEILQYARAILTRDEIRMLISGLEKIAEPEPVEQA